MRLTAKYGPAAFTVMHPLGRMVSKAMDSRAIATYEEIAEELGTTKQNAYHETMIALGRLTFRLHLMQDVLARQRRSMGLRPCD
jgi:hypothetical protein